jgi:integrase
MKNKPYKIVNRLGKRYVYKFGKKITLSNGKRKELLAHSASELKEKIRVTKLEDDRGLETASLKLTVDEVAERFLAYRRGIDAPNTHKSRVHHLNKYILPALGRLKARNVRQKHIRSFYSNIEETNGSKRVEQIHKELNPMIKWAMSAGIGFVDNPIPEDVLKRIRDTRRADAKFDEMNQADDTYPVGLSEKILSAVRGYREEIAVHMQLLHGLRVGEALAIQFEDIDLDSETIKINKQVNESPKGLRNETRYQSNSYLVITPVKTKRSNRVLPLHYKTRALIDLIPKKERTGHVLATSKNGPVSPSNYNTRIMGRLSRYLGIKLSSHDLRKLYASMLIENGESIVKVSRNLGHSKISTTLDHYAKLIE